MTQSIPFEGPAASGTGRLRELTARLASSRWLPFLSLTAVAALAFGLNAWDLSGAGLGNTYYAAAARSMSLSWKNFFFNAFDPGGFITVDKPPVFLWFGALSVRIFGYSSWSLLLPSAFAGAATVALVWLIVRRYFGVTAATIAGLVLALTPITVAVSRLNLPEPFLALWLVGAAWALLRSLESRRWLWWTIAAGAFVGLAFNTKMLAGWIPGPAFALAVVAGVASWRNLRSRKLFIQLAALAAATFIVSFSWMLVVDAWPASSRPYIGGSSDNSVANLAFNYNGLGRVNGNERPGPVGSGNRPPASTSRPNAANGGFLGNIFRNSPAANPGPGGARGAGGIIAGSPGMFRMFDAANGGQIAWFLPFAALGGLLCLWEWRRNPVRRAAVVLALGWVVLFGGVFSYAQGIYHSYYTSVMAPGAGMLVGMTAAAAAGLIKRNRLWITPLAGITVVTLLVQLKMAGRFPGFQVNARPLAIGVVIAAGMFVLLSAFAPRRLRPMPGLAVVIAGLLIMPASWSFYEAANASLNTTLPQAGPRAGAAGRSFGSNAFDSGTNALASWLHAHSDPTARWDLVVSSAQNASTLIAQDNLSVMALGGFMGSDPAITPAQFADLVAKGEVRYVLTGGAGGRGGFIPRNFSGTNNLPGPNTFGGRNRAAPGTGIPRNGSAQPAFPSFAAGGATAAANPTLANTPGAGAVMQAVQGACIQATTPDVPAQYQGQIYDCAGAANALRNGQ